MMNQETEFVSLNLPDENNTKTDPGGLNFLPSNYDYNNPKSSDNSGDSTTLQFGELGKNNEAYFFKLVFKPSSLNLRSTSD